MIALLPMSFAQVVFMSLSYSVTGDVWEVICFLLQGVCPSLLQDKRDVGLRFQHPPHPRWNYARFSTNAEYTVEGEGMDDEDLPSCPSIPNLPGLRLQLFI